MNASKILTSAIATATIVGAVGFAYAQSTTGTAPAGGAPSTEATVTPNPSAAPAATQMPAQDSTTPKPSESTQSGQTTATDTSSSASSEPLAKADRN